jgi:hypothetical protein
MAKGPQQKLEPLLDLAEDEKKSIDQAEKELDAWMSRNERDWKGSYKYTF